MIRKKIRTLIKKILSFNDWILFGSSALGLLGLVSTAIYLCEATTVDLPFLKLHELALYLIFIHSLFFGLAVVYFRRVLEDGHSHHRPPSDSANGDSSILANDLIVSLKQALNDRHYAEVLRIGSALIRPLFESGSFEARLEIGKLVEEAALADNKPEAQMIALIDAIGWSCVELGEYEKAENGIAHGFQIAKKLENNFYMAKAKRHLGVICRRRKDYSTAEARYREALEEAARISDATQRNESEAGLDYALACLYEHTNRYPEALKAIDSAIRRFDQLGDGCRVPMSLTEKAKIYFKANNISDAKDMFRKALQISETNGQRLYAVRSHIGLTRIYLQSRDWGKAKDSLDAAGSLTKGIRCSAEVLEIESLRREVPDIKHEPLEIPAHKE